MSWLLDHAPLMVLIFLFTGFAVWGAAAVGVVVMAVVGAWRAIRWVAGQTRGEGA